MIDNALETGASKKSTMMIQDLRPGWDLYEVSCGYDQPITHRIVKNISNNPKSDFRAGSVIIEFEDGTFEEFINNTPMDVSMEWNGYNLFYTTSGLYAAHALRRYCNKRFNEIDNKIKTLREERKIYEQYLLEECR